MGDRDREFIGVEGYAAIPREKVLGPTISSSSLCVLLRGDGCLDPF